jgi:hypothetical protein
MKYSELSQQQLKSLLGNLQYLIDGNYNYVEDVVAETGLSLTTAVKVHESIVLLQELDLNS